MFVGIWSTCGLIWACVYECVRIFVGSQRGTQDKVGRSHPLVVDCEVVVEANNALSLVQKAAVGGLRPPVQQVS